ncbi:translation initiation factor IF-2-like [Schistocerca gregaria]|uniref:translation initiation factor IF-2-like n=1 Tax=Schistocerca gregaria TaxID=7010 RepID=UPI00211E652E|nr:translation initiation factor IF-2-like [Schistocerca gregaria]
MAAGPRGLGRAFRQPQSPGQYPRLRHAATAAASDDCASFPGPCCVAGRWAWLTLVRGGGGGGGGCPSRRPALRRPPGPGPRQARPSRPAPRGCRLLTPGLAPRPAYRVLPCPALPCQAGASHLAAAVSPSPTSARATERDTAPHWPTHRRLYAAQQPQSSSLPCQKGAHSRRSARRHLLPAARVGDVGLRQMRDRDAPPRPRGSALALRRGLRLQRRAPLLASARRGRRPPGSMANLDPHRLRPRGQRPLTSAGRSCGDPVPKDASAPGSTTPAGFSPPPRRERGVSPPAGGDRRHAHAQSAAYAGPELPAAGARFDC